MNPDLRTISVQGSNLRDYIAGLLIALLVHGCLLTIIASLWGGKTIQARPMLPYGESSLAMTFVAPPSPMAAAIQPQAAPLPAAPVYTEPVAEEEAEDTPVAPEPPAQPRESPPAPPEPEQPPAAAEKSAGIAPADSADDAFAPAAGAQTEHGTALRSDAGQAGDGAAAPSDADGLSKGIQGLPRMSSGVRPVYPLGARHRGEQGNVTVRVQVGANGRVKESAIARSSGHLELDQAALKAIKRARFTPGRKNGVAAESESLITFRFQLED